MDVEKLGSYAKKLLDYTLAAGATEADAVASYGTDTEVVICDQRVENLTQAVAKSIGVRVFVGQRQAITTSRDFSDTALKTLATKAVSLAKLSDEDPFAGLAESTTEHSDNAAGMQQFDPEVDRFPIDQRIEWAKSMEAYTRQNFKQVKKSRGSGVTSGSGAKAVVNSRGRMDTRAYSVIRLWCSPIASEGDEMQTGSWSEAQCWLADLPSPESVAEQAAQRSTRMLGAKAVQTQRVPILFEPRMTPQFLSSLGGAIVGDRIRKRMSYLVDRLDTQIASPLLSIIDDPHVVKGMGSTLFDGDGLPTHKKAIIEQGVLKTYIYDTYTGRRCDQQSTHNARRGGVGTPSPGLFNTHIQPHEGTLEQFIAETSSGLLVTGLMGGGTNGVTGDFSCGAQGLWIENGEIAFPVREITLAGNYLDMLNNIDRVGADYEFFGTTGAPSMRVADVMISGKG